MPQKLHRSNKTRIVQTLSHFHFSIFSENLVKRDVKT